MSEVAEMFDINQSQLRSWENQFPSLKPHRNRKGNRLFTENDLETLKIIYNLVKVKGLRVSSAVKEIGISGSELRRNSLMIEKLLSIRSSLTEVLEQMKDDDQNPIVYESQNRNNEKD